ncbi:ABC transporter ATP-binding protein [Selenomonas sp.]|uniref:ABC transporter ATP-binding protein n=1 Tax=Selenomonas sp. TaxID=2053611 RepID=UPI003FA23953
MLSVRNLSFAVGDKTILHDVSVNFAEGKITAILGANGSGKSTLMSFLGKNRAAPGHIFLCGKDISGIPSHAYAQRAAMLPQQRETIADFTVEDVVVMGRFPYKRQFRDYTEADYEIAQSAMREVGIEVMARRRIGSMSGGEIQRVMIAKVLAQRPELILMDEPTNHLDVRYKVALMNTLRAYGGTIILVLHDLSLAAQYADRVVVMKHGRIREEGDTADVMRTELLEEIFGVPFVRFEKDGRVYLNY